MSDDIRKSLAVSESDPAEISDRQYDEEGSFLDLYRSLSLPHLSYDTELLSLLVANGVVPTSVRYGIMSVGDGEVVRGVAKSTTGAQYFTWRPGVFIRVVPAETMDQQQEAGRLYKNCALGFFSKSLGDDSEDEDDADKAVPGTGSVPRTEEQWAKEQASSFHEVHPGDTAAQTPDDPDRGRVWHKALSVPSDGMAPLAGSSEHWDTAALVKAWGRRLQETAPRPMELSPLEREYLTGVLGVSEDQISKGFSLPPRHRMSFEQWKSGRLRTKLHTLSKWLDRK